MSRSRLLTRPGFSFASLAPRRSALFGGLALLAAVAALAVPRIPQDPAYLHFADHRAVLGIPNAADVLSNTPFLLAGVLGLAVVLSPSYHRRRLSDPSERPAWVVLFVGLVLACAGSSWFHLAPGMARLVWDRIPITIVFMAFFAAAVAERVSVRLGARLLIPLVAAGIASVLYWRWTELRGAGDLRPYAAVQFFPMLAMPLLIALWPARYTRQGALVGVLALYAAAKGAEMLDRPIRDALGGAMSGHTLKHLLAGAASLLIVWMVARREPLVVAAPDGTQSAPAR